MKSFKQKKLFIFDFDGTLVDSCALHAKAFHAVLKPWQISFNYQDIVGMKTKDAMIKLLRGGDIELPEDLIRELIKKKQDLVRKQIKNDLQLMPNVADFIKKAHTSHEMVVVSAGSRLSIDIAFEKFNLYPWFKMVITSEDVTHAKPHPEGFLMALDKMQVDACQALVFEDSEPGFLAAKAAGIDYINVHHFDWKYSS
jgi:beta-phosphoglucomutase